jgi:enediyne biosynthesis protein CalE5
VLRPGGRAVVAVWGPREQNPWLSGVFDAVTAELGIPVPPPGVPGPFSLDDAGALSALLIDAGLVDVRVDEVSVPLRVGSFDEWWGHTTALAGPLATLLASLPAETQDSLQARLQVVLGGYEVGDGYEFPGVSVVASARRGPTP